ncbi:biotin transporter BioY [Desulfuribacillus alkaliarsenatis]|uniref:Biotin transporter n=1 Tax=Desulfuribacillus alkaliarsenatis TaxID=766136 RepID=A0A1E5FZL8_9FIRM|nr:biotin transporter BioY [Desulfuribacillus alkaliarsenatis]OEF96035.1 hypothetical protein BHF68_09825 [Desulfuribacillus alkaliarsenatis]
MHNHRIKTYYLVLVPLFTALTIIGTFIKIPTPIVPITLQTLFVILSGALLGSKMGALSQVLYVTLGLIGLPVFSQGGGFSYIFNPTFGYLLGFIAGSFVIGYIIEHSKNKNMFTFLIANLSGLFVIYLIGVTYMYLILNYVSLTAITINQAIVVGFLTPLPKDLVVAIFVTIIATKIIRQATSYRLM